MLAPKKAKYRKWHRTDRIKGKASSKLEISFGSYGLKAQSAGLVSSRQIEASRRTMTRFIQRGGKIWIRIFPDRPITKKGAEVPMGGGKGTVEYYVAVVKPGTIIFEMDGVAENVAQEAMKLAAYKLPVKCKFMVK